jgi:hypothetical protein
MKKSFATFCILLGLASCMAVSSGLTAADRLPGAWKTVTRTKLPTVQGPTLEERVASLEAALEQSQQRLGDLETQLATQSDFLLGLQEHIAFDGNGNLQIEAMEIELDAWSDLNISSSSTNVSAAEVSVDSPLVNFAGMIRSEVVETKSVISSTYTPGAGNIL